MKASCLTCRHLKCVVKDLIYDALIWFEEDGLDEEVYEVFAKYCKDYEEKMSIKCEECEVERQVYL